MTVKGKKAKRGDPGAQAPDRPRLGISRRQTTLYIVCEGHTERDYFELLAQRHPGRARSRQELRRTQA